VKHRRRNPAPLEAPGRCGLTDRERRILAVLLEAVESGRAGMSAMPDMVAAEFKHHRRRMLHLLRHYGTKGWVRRVKT